MSEFTVENFNFIFNDYQNSDNKNFSALFSNFKDKYQNKDYAYCLNHILSNYLDIDLLNYTLKEISKLKSDENFPALIDFILINSGDSAFSNLKVMAIKIIATYNNKNAIQPLLYCLNNKNSNYKIRFAAAEALGKIGDNAAYDSLKKVAMDEEEKSVYVRESAVVALGLLGDNRAFDVFDSIINSSQMFLDKFSYFKERIVEAIEKLESSSAGNKKALHILKTSILDKSPYLRITTIETLMNLNLDESYDLIYDRLINDDDFEVQKNALYALYNLRGDNILNEVLRGEFSPELKQCAQDVIDNNDEVDDE